MSSLTNSTDALRASKRMRLVEAAVGEGVDGALDRLHGEGGVGGDLGGDGHGGGLELLAGRDLLHDAETFRLGGGDAATRQRQQLGMAGTDFMSQAEVSARIDGDARLRLG